MCIFFPTSQCGRRHANVSKVQEKPSLAKRVGGEDERILAETALMMPHSVSQVQIKTENRQQKKREEPGSSKQVNWRCWMLQVCGRPGKLAILHLFISSRSHSTYTHSLLHPSYCVLNAGKSS